MAALASDHMIAPEVNSAAATARAWMVFVLAVVVVATEVDASSRVIKIRLADVALDLLYEVITIDGCMASEFCRPGLER